MKYRALIVCGNDLESLEPDYDKQYNLIVHDPELDTLYDPTQFSPSANAYHRAHYVVECKFCKEYIRLPATVREISLSAQAYMNFNALGMNHRIQVVHLDPTVTEDDDFLNVREDTGDEYGVLGDSGPLTLTNRKKSRRQENVVRARKKLDEVKCILDETNHVSAEDSLKKKQARMDTLWKLFIVSLMVSAILKFFDIILKGLTT